MSAQTGSKASPPSGAVRARAYASPTLVLLAMDWPAGARHENFLGFAIARAPGFQPGEKDGYLVNKIGFLPPQAHSQPLPSSLSPIQKFMWPDCAIADADRGRIFEYTITPVLGSGPHNLVLRTDAALTLSVGVPGVMRDDIWTWFNRAVVSSQALAREFPDPPKQLDACMKWLANGLDEAFPEILKGAQEVSGAIYHLTDKQWVMPAFKAYTGSLSIVYENRKTDQTNAPAIKMLKSSKFTGWPRSKTHIMHDKFLVDTSGGRVLAGSANFTPEALAAQANLLHIFESRELALLYEQRQTLLRDDRAVGATAQGAGWSAPVKVGKANVRVFFSPEPNGSRVCVDTVVKAVKNAKSSVVFCLFDPTDAELLAALLGLGDQNRLVYGLLSSICDPAGKNNDLSDSGEAPNAPSPSTQIKMTLYNRSRRDKKVVAYSYFARERAPARFLPELSSVDFSSRSVLPPRKGGASQAPPAVHIRHKFIVVDADTNQPVIYTGSANLSKSSTNFNDENLLEITGSPELAQTYFAEFMRLFEHYRAQALWDVAQRSVRRTGRKRSGPEPNAKIVKTFTLGLKRDDWVRGAYQEGTAEYLARTTLAAPGGGGGPRLNAERTPRTPTNEMSKPA